MNASLDPKTFPVTKLPQIDYLSTTSEIFGAITFITKLNGFNKLGG
jgi:hypothetical protein